MNFPGSFNCTCQNGFTGNGFYCNDIDECLLKEEYCGNQTSCVNLFGSFSCTSVCKLGFAANVSGCVDVNECELNVHNCDTKSSCINSDGSYHCNCLPGYTGDGFNCSDINECTSNAHPCSKNRTCRNTPGSYECVCDEKLGNCVPINGCFPECHPNAICTKVHGSFICRCITGFANDGQLCTGSSSLLFVCVHLRCNQVTISSHVR